MGLFGFPKPSIWALLFFFLLLLMCSSSHGFSMNFYALSCPTVEIIVRDAVRSAAATDPSVPGKLLRLLFHDCFVEGCDGSVLLEGNKTERSDPANTSLGGFQVIDAAKTTLELFCPSTVSCADVLALAARDAVFLVGGPLIDIPTGRRDGRVSAIENVRPNIVDTTFTLDQMMALFSSKGLSLQDLLVLSGKRNLGVLLEVVHKHGECTKIKSTSTSYNLDQLEMFRLDQVRVDSIHSRVLSMADEKVILKKRSTTLTSKSGISIGSGNYIVSVGLGTPKKTLSLVFDTGSDLTWTQCKPCVGSCYEQVDPTFDPSASKTYYNISCTSAACMELVGQSSAVPACTRVTGTCVYGVEYGDSSFSVGLLAKEHLTLTSSDYVEGFMFGCGESNEGLFGRSAGLLGLGRNKLSIVSQAAPKYGKYFSYCLPPHSSSTGHLTFGKGATRAKTISYTPLLKSSKSSTFYSVALESISVGGIRLPISPKAFSTGGCTLIDSGTVITRLPPQPYSALASSFKKLMSKYTSAPAFSILDTCFDLSAYSTVSIPKLVLGFRGGAALDLPPSGILFVVKASQVCLAFAGNSMDSSVAIVGNVQQKSFDVVYDVDGGKIGFGPDAC